jgi:hypothetical protein
LKERIDQFGVFPGYYSLGIEERGKKIMKQIAFVFIFLLSLVVGATTVSANPIDLTTFLKDPGVSADIPTGTITFVEQESKHAIYFYDDLFQVPNDAGDLSFNYSLNLGNDNDDYLVAVIDYTTYLFEHNVGGSGSFSIDFSPYRGQIFSLAFGLESNDQASGTTATISKLDLAVSTVPVPEPGTCLLLAMGLMGLFCHRRKKAANSI